MGGLEAQEVGGSGFPVIAGTRLGDGTPQGGLQVPEGPGEPALCCCCGQRPGPRCGNEEGVECKRGGGGDSEGREWKFLVGGRRGQRPSGLGRMLWALSQGPSLAWGRPTVEHGDCLTPSKGLPTAQP